MIAGQNHPVGPGDRDPTSRFDRLGSLIDKQRRKAFALQYPASRTHQGTGDNPGFGKQLRIDTYLQAGRPYPQFSQLIMQTLPVFTPAFT